MPASAGVGGALAAAAGTGTRTVGRSHCQVAD